MLEVQGLSVRYDKHIALRDAALSVRPGEIVVILGANGAGKSTLLKAIAGICEGQPTGHVTMDGVELMGLPAHMVVEQGIALVPEGRGVFGDLTVRENLMLGANPVRAREESRSNFDRVVRLFPKLEDRAAQTVATMSGGEQQMVAIGRAMMSNPTILMLDEPSLGLSPLLSRELFQSLKAVRAAGLGILLVEQNAKLSLGIADRGYLLENGQIQREDRADVLKNDPAVQAAYLGGAAGHATPHGPLGRRGAPAPAAVEPAPLPAGFQVRARATSSVSASQVSGLDIDAIVAGAGRRAQDDLPRTALARATPAARAPAAAMAPRPEALRAALDEIETAARRAMAGGGAPSSLPPLRPTARPAAIARADAPPPGPPPPAPALSDPVPGGRIEVYRRRPGTSQFDRTEVRDA